MRRCDIYPSPTQSLSYNNRVYNFVYNLFLFRRTPIRYYNIDNVQTQIKSNMFLSRNKDFFKFKLAFQPSAYIASMAMIEVSSNNKQQLYNFYVNTTCMKQACEGLSTVQWPAPT